MTRSNRLLSAALATVLLVGGLTVASATPSDAAYTTQSAPGVNVGPAELVYTNESSPLDQWDGSFATLRRDANTFYFWHSDGGNNVMKRYWGTIENPLANALPNGTVNMNGRNGYAWLYNIYAVTSTTLLGFAHVESNGVPGWGCTPSSCYFNEGLLYSTDGGASWLYLGDILSPKVNYPDSVNNNVGGVPYLVVGNYFYVYFNDWDGTGTKHLSVARASVSDVLAAAASGTVTTWMKYSGGSWTGNAFTSFGDDIVPQSANTGAQDQRDIHADAAYNSALGRYMLTVHTLAKGNLLLFTSTDGVNWGQETLLDSTDANNFIQTYSFFLDTQNNSLDSHIVGSDFRIFYPRKDWPSNYGYVEFYSRRITIGAKPAQTYVPTDSYRANLQGTDGWRSQQRVGSTYSDLTWSTSNNWWQGTASTAVINDNWVHPDVGVDIVRSWTAPANGVIRITGNPRKWDLGGDGVTASIVKNGTQVWPASGTQLITTRTGATHDITVSVTAGDVIHFVLGVNGNHDYDKTYWDPTIAYSFQAQLGFSPTTPTQGANGWGYYQSNGSSSTAMTWDATNLWWHGTATHAVITNTWQHPDVGAQSIRTWTAPAAGTVEIRGVVSKEPAIGVGGNGVDVRILRGTIQIWPASGWQHLNGTDTTGVTATVTTTVTAGQVLSFVVDSSGNSDYDATAWNPEVVYK